MWTQNQAVFFTEQSFFNNNCNKHEQKIKKKKKKKRARVWSLPQWVHILLGFGNRAGAEMRGTARCQNTHNISCSCHVIRVRIEITLSSPSAVTVLGGKLTAEVAHCGFHSKFDLNSFYRSTALSTNLIFIHDFFFFFLLAVVMHRCNDHWINWSVSRFQ